MVGAALPRHASTQKAHRRRVGRPHAGSDVASGPRVAQQLARNRRVVHPAALHGTSRVRVYGVAPRTQLRCPETAVCGHCPRSGPPADTWPSNAFHDVTAARRPVRHPSPAAEWTDTLDGGDGHGRREDVDRSNRHRRARRPHPRAVAHLRTGGADVLAGTGSPGSTPRTVTCPGSETNWRRPGHCQS
jgi:hypothetical protein